MESSRIARVASAFDESIRVKRAVADSSAADIAMAATWIAEALSAGGKLLLFGNGGSAADAQHVATELVGRFEQEGRALAAVALTVDSSALTALANDYGFDRVFSRQVEALARPGDIVLAFSTSGGSTNVVVALDVARAAGLRTIALTGETGGAVAAAADMAVRVPSRRTARIQEAHITICHVICELIEAELRP